MMLHCRDRITPDQVAELQKFKDYAGEFDHARPEFAALLNFNLDKYRVDESAPKDVQERPIEMSQAEVAMQTIVEVIISVSV